MARAASLPAGEVRQVVTIGLIGLGLVVVSPARWWFARLVVAAGAGGLLYRTQGALVAAWLPGGLVLAAWIAQGRPPLPFLPKPGPGTKAPVAVLVGVAAYVGATKEASWPPVVPFGLACALPIVGLLGGGLIDRASRRVGSAAGGVVSSAMFGLLAPIAVALPWSLQRLLRIDPLAARSGWGERDRRPLQARQMWASDPVPDSARAAKRWRLTLAIGVVGVLVLGFAWQQRRPDGPDRSAGLALPPVEDADLSDESWYAEYQEDIAWVLDERVALRPFEIYRLLDVETRHVNIHGGRRDTWAPPECECRRVTVWLYGGDGVFGLEQRDDHTIASELARLAHAEGIVLDVQNKGIPGQLHWRTSLRLAWDLTTEPPPDLAVFYGGAEEVVAAQELIDTGRGDVRAPFEPYIENLYDEINDVTGPLPTPPGVENLGWPTVSDAGEGQVGELAVKRYERSLQLSDDTAAAVGVPVVYMWQPTRGTSGAAARSGTEPEDLVGDEDYAEAAAALPDRVTDLSSVFVRRDGPRFADASHHNEAGARIVARAMLDDLRDQLQSAARSAAPEDAPG